MKKEEHKNLPVPTVDIVVVFLCNKNDIEQRCYNVNNTLKVPNIYN